MSRFYSIDGQVVDVGLKEARAQGLLPSVTSIIHETWPNPGLRRWKEGQIAMAAATTPILENEPTASWLDRVRVAADGKRDTAADFGSRLHDAIENTLKPEGFRLASYHTDMDDWIDPFLQWVDENVKEVIWTEKVISNPIGYAGRADARFLLKDGRVGLPDFKTQGVKKSVSWYPEWKLQLGAYRNSTEFALVEDVACFSIVFDSGKAGMPRIREWDKDEILDGWLCFHGCLKFWKMVNNFYPNNVDELSPPSVNLNQQ